MRSTRVIVVPRTEAYPDAKGPAMDDPLRYDLQDLARASRILARHGHEDMTLGHVSLRDPEGRGIWLKRRGLALGDLRTELDFQLLDWDGAVLEGQGKPHSEWALHSEVLRTRPDLLVGAHTHARNATLLSALDCDFAPLTQDGLRLLGQGIARFDDTPDLIRTRDGGAAVARSLGNNAVVLMKNHGLCFFADSVPRLALLGVFLERAAEAFLTAAATGLPLRPAATADAPLMLASMDSDDFITDNWAYLLRALAHREA